MGVYIKGVEMPTSCAKCKLFGEYGFPFVGAVGYALTRGERNEDCPLSPIPPHGRLIDAGELERKIGENIDKAKSRGQGAYGWWYACNVAEDFVLSAPTIIEAEEGET